MVRLLTIRSDKATNLVVEDVLIMFDGGNVCLTSDKTTWVIDLVHCFMLPCGETFSIPMQQLI